MVVVEAVRGELARAEQQRPGRLTQGNAASVGQVRDDDRCRCCPRHAHDVAALAARMEVKLAALPESRLNAAPAGECVWRRPLTPLTSPAGPNFIRIGNEMRPTSGDQLPLGRISSA